MTLEQKIRDLLARLSVLSEAKASNLEPRTSHGPADSKVPAGVRIAEADPDRPPSKERSLFDFYAFQFQRAAENPERLTLLLFLGERDYHTRCRDTESDFPARRIELRSGRHIDPDSEAEAKRTGKDPAWPKPLHSQGGVDGAAAERLAAQQVVDLYEGKSAEEAAVFEGTTVRVIHKARKMHQRNTDDGRPRPPFLDWDEDEREQQVARLRKDGKGSKAIAQHFGVDAGTIRRYGQPALVAA